MSNKKKSVLGWELREIAHDLRRLGRDMSCVSDRMKYYGGFNIDIIARAKELKGASKMAKSWARDILARRHIPNQ